MEVLNLGKLPGYQSMLIFHALARMGYEGLVLVSPSKPIASVGYFQDVDRELDLKNCREAGIPVIRREVGGGSVYLDENQVFYHLVWKRADPRFPKKVADIFEMLSGPPIDTYEEFGIPTEFRPANDIVTKEGKKIAGEGGADIEDSMVFVGSIIRDFDYDTMSRIIRVPDEKFRDKVHKTIEDNLTTMKRELGEAPPREDIEGALIRNFEKVTGPLSPVELSTGMIEKMVELEKWFTSEEFLHKRTPRIPQGIKIREGVDILYSIYKARGGLIRTAQEVHDGVIRDISISGDFTLFPKSGVEAMQESLKDAERRGEIIQMRLEEFYEREGVETPGVEPEDVKSAIMEAK